MVAIWNLWRNVRYRRKFKELSIQVFAVYSSFKIPSFFIEDFFDLVNWTDNIRFNQESTFSTEFLNEVEQIAKKNIQYHYYLLIIPSLKLQPDLNENGNLKLKGKDIIGAVNWNEIADEICYILSWFCSQPFFLTKLNCEISSEERAPDRINSKKEFEIIYEDSDQIDYDKTLHNLFSDLLCLIKMDEKDYKVLLNSFIQFRSALILKEYDKSSCYAMAVSAVDILAQEYVFGRSTRENFTDFICKFDVYDKQFKNEFVEVLNNIYYARSINFHNGIQFTHNDQGLNHMNRFNLRKFIWNKKIKKWERNPDYKLREKKGFNLNGKKITYPIVKRIPNFNGFLKIYNKIVLKLLEILPAMVFPYFDIIKKDFDKSSPNNIDIALRKGGIKPFSIITDDQILRDIDYFDKISQKKSI